MIRYILASPPISESERAVFVLSSDLIAKEIVIEQLDDEVAGLNIAQQLHIRVPTVKRVVQTGRTSYVVMDRVHGMTLEDSWTQIDWITTLRLAF